MEGTEPRHAIVMLCYSMAIVIEPPSYGDCFEFYGTCTCIVTA